MTPLLHAIHYQPWLITPEAHAAMRRAAGDAGLFNELAKRAPVPDLLTVENGGGIVSIMGVERHQRAQMQTIGKQLEDAVAGVKQLESNQATGSKLLSEAVKTSHDPREQVTSLTSEKTTLTQETAAGFPILPVAPKAVRFLLQLTCITKAALPFLYPSLWPNYLSPSSPAFSAPGKPRCSITSCTTARASASRSS